VSSFIAVVAKDVRALAGEVANFVALVAGYAAGVTWLSGLGALLGKVAGLVAIEAFHVFATSSVSSLRAFP